MWRKQTDTRAEPIVLPGPRTAVDNQLSDELRRTSVSELISPCADQIITEAVRQMVELKMNLKGASALSPVGNWREPCTPSQTRLFYWSKEHSHYQQRLVKWKNGSWQTWRIDSWQLDERQKFASCRVCFTPAALLFDGQCERNCWPSSVTSWSQ